MKPSRSAYETVNFNGKLDYLYLGGVVLGPEDISVLSVLEVQMSQNPHVESQIFRGDVFAEIADLYFQRGDTDGALKNIDKAITANDTLINGGTLDIVRSYRLSANNLAFCARQMLYQGSPVDEIRPVYIMYLKELLADITSTNNLSDVKKNNNIVKSDIKGLITELCLLILVSGIETDKGPIIGFPSFKRQDEAYGHKTPWDVSARQYSPENELIDTYRLQAKTVYFEEFAPEDEGELIYIYGTAHMQFSKDGSANGIISALLEKYPTQTQQRTVGLAERNIQDEIEARAA